MMEGTSKNAIFCTEKVKKNNMLYNLNINDDE